MNVIPLPAWDVLHMALFLFFFKGMILNSSDCFWLPQTRDNLS